MCSTATDSAAVAMPVAPAPVAPGAIALVASVATWVVATVAIQAAVADACSCDKCLPAAASAVAWAIAAFAAACGASWLPVVCVAAPGSVLAASISRRASAARSPAAPMRFTTSIAGRRRPKPLTRTTRRGAHATSSSTIRLRSDLTNSAEPDSNAASDWHCVEVGLPVKAPPRVNGLTLKAAPRREGSRWCGLFLLDGAAGMSRSKIDPRHSERLQRTRVVVPQRKATWSKNANYYSPTGRNESRIFSDDRSTSSAVLLVCSIAG